MPVLSKLLFSPRYRVTLPSTESLHLRQKSGTPGGRIGLKSDADLVAVLGRYGRERWRSHQ